MAVLAPERLVDNIQDEVAFVVQVAAVAACNAK